MKKFICGFVVLFALIGIPSGVHAASKTVNSQEELLQALSDSTIDTIQLGSNIQTTQKIDVTRDVVIDGNNKTIQYNGEFKDDIVNWHGIYVLNIYTSKVTIQDISLTNGNRALGVNGSQVTLEGEINVSGNAMDAIELGRGSGVTSVSTLTVSDQTVIVNDSETDAKKTLFVDDADAKIVRINSGKTTEQDLVKGTRLTLKEVNVNVIDVIGTNHSIDESTFTEIKNNNQNLVMVAPDGMAVWAFEGSKIVKPMAVNTEITFTEEAPGAIKSSVDKVILDLKDVSFLNFSHSGELPGLAEVAYDVSDKYSVGTKLYVAHFNESTGKLENVQEGEVDEDGFITFEVSECSSYVLYTGKVEANNTTGATLENTSVKNVTNPKTGDIHLIEILSMIGCCGIGLGLLYKKISIKLNK